MVSLNKLVQAACLMMCTSTASLAGVVETSEDGLYKVLSSDKDAIIENWPELRQSILDAYGVRELQTMSAFDYDAFGQKKNPPAFEMKEEDFEGLVFDLSLRDTSMLTTLTDLFSDLTVEEASSFEDGLLVEAQKTADGKHELTIEFYKRVVHNSFGGFGLDAPFPVRFPAGTKILTQQGGENGAPTVYYLEVPSGQGEVASKIAEQLFASDLEIQQFNRKGADVVVATSPKGDLIMQAMDDQGGYASTVHLVVINN